MNEEGFAALIEPLAPFERPPRLAVAVSGGGDSMALCLLAHAWVASQGGRLLAITVDHDLRRESADEARRVGEWLSSRGIDHLIVKRQEELQGGIQAGARAIRYRLLEQVCRQHGILHLLVGHTREDQAETVALRRVHGSGPAGMAAMDPLVETPCLRLLRPLLSVQRQELRDYLVCQGQEWIEDPSNQDTRYERVRLRSEIRLDGAWHRDRLVATAAERAADRDRLDREAATLAARFVRVDPAGYAQMHPAIVSADRPVLERLLGRLCRTIGGLAYPPGRTQIAHLGGSLEQGRGGSLGRCVIAPGMDVILVYREARLLPGPVPLVPGHPGRWDERFETILSKAAPADISIGPVGQTGCLRLERHFAADRGPPDAIPKVVWPSLPAFYRGGAICAVPHLRYNEVDGAALAWDFPCPEFRPANALTPPGRRLV